MNTPDQMATQLFLTDLPETPVYREIQIDLQGRYQKNEDGEYPEEYFKELSDILFDVLSQAAALALPMRQ